MRINSLQADKCLRGSPLESHLRTFANSLVEDGYTDRTIELKLGLLACLWRWLQPRKLPITDLDEQLLKAFVKQRRRVHGGDFKTLGQFLDHLQKRGIVSVPKPVCDRSPLAAILNQYETYLRSERGLVAHTILNYQTCVRKFLFERFREGPFCLQKIRPSDISGFVLRHGPDMAVGTAHQMTTAFRSFFRFLFQRGELQADLTASVPMVADRRLSTVPKHLSPEEVQRMLKACDRRTACGRRDYAILLLLARLGLRAGEVVALRLEDINWRAGEILIRGKGLLHDWMPLPGDVGEALSSYLSHGRPASQTRRVFLRMLAPRRGFTNTAVVRSIVCQALGRADLHPAFKGAHLLRHSLATSMLRSGATMGEIGEVLRHRSPSTTETYAKVDFGGMRSLAHPWPMGGAQ
jgi:site-specific recombinase XerD